MIEVKPKDSDGINIIPPMRKSYALCLKIHVEDTYVTASYNGNKKYSYTD